MIKALAHVCLLSSDLQRTLDFYVGVLGLARKFDFLRGEKLIGFYLEIADLQYLEVFADDSDFQAEKPRRRLMHLCLEVSSMQVLQERLETARVAFRPPVKGADHSWQMWCQDPDGTDIEFHEYTVASLQITGGNCLVDW